MASYSTATRQPRQDTKQKVLDPKSQQADNRCTEKAIITRRMYKRSLKAETIRKANRKQRRQEKRREYRKLRKCYTVQATQYNSYQVAQECSTEDITLQPNQPIKQSTETSAKMKWTNTKIATINLGGGITPIWQTENSPFIEREPD